MTAVEDIKHRARQLCDQARSVTLRALDIQTQTLMLAEATAATEDQIAATLDQLARQQPHRAGHLRDMGESARRYAARERKWLMRQSASMPEAEARTTTPDHAGDLCIIRERDRIAAQLRDTIIRRVFGPD
jgi:hypothetical protein